MLRSVSRLFLVPVLLLISCRGRDSAEKNELEAWPVPIEVRVERSAFSREPENRTIVLEGLAGEVLSAQVAVRSAHELRQLRAVMSDLEVSDGARITSGAGRLRFGGFVPVDETMSLMADPLLEDQALDVPANLAQPVWLTLKLPSDARPGHYRGKLGLSAASGQATEFELQVEVLPAVLPEPRDWSFRLYIWQDPTPVAKAHGVEPWSEEHWAVLERYAANFYEHGLKEIMTHITHDPWNGVRGWASDEMVIWKYPGEYRPGTADRFDWDFTVFDRYVRLMIAAGVEDKISLYAMVMGPWIIPDAHIRYLDTTSGQFRTLRQNVGEPLWREAWRAFLPVLRDHLRQNDWFERSVLGFDEKPEEIMRVIFALVDSVAPDFRMSQAGGYAGDEQRRGEDLILHMESFQDPVRWAELKPVIERYRQDPDRHATFYTACSPWYPNTFLFSQLRESRLMPWLARRYGFEGYTRWALNLFPENVWEQPRFTWASGDMFFVWPGKDGPLDSMRWELLRQGIQDYEVYRLAEEAARAAGRQDLLERLDRALQQGSVIDNCGAIPPIEDARREVNAVLRELGS